MKVIEYDDRISALDADGVEICGAFNSPGHTYWTLFVTQSVSRLTGLRTPPHREHFVGNHGRSDAKAWVELLATLYDLAVNQKAVA